MSPAGAARPRLLAGGARARERAAPLGPQAARPRARRASSGRVGLGRGCPPTALVEGVPSAPCRPRRARQAAGRSRWAGAGQVRQVGAHTCCRMETRRRVGRPCGSASRRAPRSRCSAHRWAPPAISRVPRSQPDPLPQPVLASKPGGAGRAPPAGRQQDHRVLGEVAPPPFPRRATQPFVQVGVPTAQRGPGERGAGRGGLPRVPTPQAEGSDPTERRCLLVT